MYIRQFLHTFQTGILAAGISVNKLPSLQQTTLDPDKLSPYVDPLPIPEIAKPSGMLASPEDASLTLPYYRMAMRQIDYSNLSSCLLFYRNYRLLGPDEAGGFYTAHFWSLAIEEHFYLIWPVLLIAVKPKRAGTAAFLLAMAVAAWPTVVGHFELWPGILIPSNLLARSDAKIDALLWGCIAAIYFPAIKRYVEGIRFTELWLPIVAILLVVEKLHAPGLIVLQAVLIPAFVLSTVIQSGNLLGRFLEWQPLRWIGTISYSVYLWQEIFLPMVASERALGAFRYLQQPPWNVLAILVCARLSRYLIELPTTRLGHRLSASPTESTTQQTFSLGSPPFSPDAPRSLTNAFAMREEKPCFVL